MKAFPGMVVRALVRWLRALDRGLVGIAGAFGAAEKRAIDCCGVYLLLCAQLYVVALLSLPILPLVGLGLAYLSVLAVGRAWVDNEKRRTAIARKLADGDPDNLPDLRGLALLSAGQLVLIFPLIFQNAQRDFHLFHLPDGASFRTWLAFTFESFSKALVAWTEIYDVRFTSITYASEWGRHLVLLKRLTFDFILIQGLLRLVDIRVQIREGGEAVGRDADLAARLGRRAVPMLIGFLDHDDARIRKQAAHALGAIGDDRAVMPLRCRLTDDCQAVRNAAAAALGEFGDPAAVDLLIEVLLRRDSEKIVVYHDRREAASALGKLGDRRAVTPLLEAFPRCDRTAQRAVLDSLEQLGEHATARALAAPATND